LKKTHTTDSEGQKHKVKRRVRDSRCSPRVPRQVLLGKGIGDLCLMFFELLDICLDLLGGGMQTCFDHLGGFQVVELGMFGK
jgi:hypothetical protein